MPQEPEKEYEVERIIGKRNEEDREFYLVKWKGYPQNESTWEPIDNLWKVKKMIRKYNESLVKSVKPQASSKDSLTVEEYKHSQAASKNEISTSSNALKDQAVSSNSEVVSVPSDPIRKTQNTKPKLKMRRPEPQEKTASNDNGTQQRITKKVAQQKTSRAQNSESESDISSEPEESSESKISEEAKSVTIRDKPQKPTKQPETIACLPKTTSKAFEHDLSKASRILDHFVIDKCFYLKMEALVDGQKKKFSKGFDEVQNSRPDLLGEYCKKLIIDNSL